MIFRYSLVVLICSIIFFQLKFCSSDLFISENNGSENIQVKKPRLLVSTIDGGLHLLEIDKSNNRFNKLWQNNFGSILSTSLNEMQKKSYDNDNQIGILPSLDGRLYRYNSKISPDFLDNQNNPFLVDSLQEYPFDLDEVLSSSFKFNNEHTIVGDKKIVILGINSQTGKLLYNCSSNGCEKSVGSKPNKDENNNLLVIKSTNYLLRFVSYSEGDEKGNISLIKNEVLSKSGLIGSMVVSNMFIGYDKSTNPTSITRQTEIDEIKNKLSFDIENGIVGFEIEKPNHMIEFSLAKPIIKCELFMNDNYNKINIFLYNKKFTKHDLKRKDALSIYIDNYHIGKYGNLIYVQNKCLWENQATNDQTTNKNNYHTYNKKMGKETISFEDELNIYAKNKNINANKNNKINKKSVKKSNANLNLPNFEEFIDQNEMNLSSNKIINNMINSLILIYNDIQIIQIIIAAFVLTVFTLVPKFYRRFQKNQCDIAINLIQSSIDTDSDDSSITTRSLIITEETNITNPARIHKQSITDINNNINSDYVSRYLADFTHIYVIGKGSFGCVFEAQHNIDLKRFAVKRIKIKNKEKEKKRVQAEVQALAKLECPYIVRYYQSWFEHPPANWQENKDADLLFKNFKELQDESQVNEDWSKSSSEFSRRKNYETSSSGYKEGGSSSSSSSFSIVFELSKNSNQSSTEDSFKCLEKKSRQDSLALSSQESSYDDEDESLNEEYLYFYIQMELCKPETLRVWLDSTKCITRQLTQIYNFFFQTLSAIDYVHKKDLIHRDLKPANILLSLDGGVKVGDFGLVESSEDEIKISNSNANLLELRSPSENDNYHDGTYLYMSPERLKRLKYNSKVDIFSLGIILYELIVPFNTEMERYETLKNLHEKNENQFSEKFSNEYPIEKALISFLVEPNPEDRPSAKQILVSAQFGDFKSLYENN